MAWINLDHIDLLETIRQDSFVQPIVLFKHSTRCSISDMALGRVNRSVFPETTKFYLLDLLQHRDISNAIAEKFSVHHESPQVLVIKNGECHYSETHQGIRMDDIIENL
jgi:bacillithiol system protein YtxJ